MLCTACLDSSDMFIRIFMFCTMRAAFHMHIIFMLLTFPLVCALEKVLVVFFFIFGCTQRLWVSSYFICSRKVWTEKHYLLSGFAWVAHYLSPRLFCCRGLTCITKKKMLVCSNPWFGFVLICSVCFSSLHFFSVLNRPHFSQAPVWSMKAFCNQNILLLWGARDTQNCHPFRFQCSCIVLSEEKEQRERY